MSILHDVLKSLPRNDISLETFDRHGQKIRQLDGVQFVAWIAAWRHAFEGERAGDLRSDGRKVVALLFRPEETIEFFVAAFAALSHGFTIVPLYPNWSAETQLEYLRAYNLHTVAVGQGFRSRAESWKAAGVRRVIPIDIDTPRPPARGERPSIPLDLSPGHPCAWIFTSGTSGKLAKLTEISLENLDAAIENIRGLDFLSPGMTLHTPLSASHIFAFVVILGFLSIRPRRVIFSDVQYLARLPQSRTGKINGLILVPIVMNRMRAAFYEKLTARLDPRTVPAELKLLARIPLSTRRFLKRATLRAERGLIRLESEGASSPVDWAARRLARTLFGRLFRRRLGSPDFVVVGGAKPNLEAMAFLEVMGIRCLQGWGMTETTGPLAVCSIGDRYRGAFGTCGNLFPSTRAHIQEDGELIVEGPQVARGYHQPDGTFLPFHGKKSTGDHVQFDSSGRLKVVGKAADRITTENGVNYNPIPFEEEIHGMDLRERNILDDVVVIGDGQPRLGAVFFLKEGVSACSVARSYVESLLRPFNGRRPVDEQIACWTLSDTPLREAGFLGPSGKLVRRRVEEQFAGIFGPLVEVGG